jgi:uncharacterized protein
VQRLACLLIVLAAILGGGCGSDDEPAATPDGGTTDALFDRARVEIDTGEQTVTVRVEVAETASQQELGLMHRDDLPADEGMVFLFERDQTGGFWMKNTRIPLSIAYYDAEGRIVRILDMDPCTADPCRTYDPGVAYRGALEVNRGAFRRWGVEPGDRLTVIR